MAKKANANSSSPVAIDEGQKKRKKQAKREAKAMLEIEKAKRAVQKAEKKVAKAQARVEARTAHLRSLEEKLSEIRTPQEETEVSAPDTGFDHQAGQPEQEEEPPASVPVAGSDSHKEGSGQEEETMKSAPDTGFDHQVGQPEVEYDTVSSEQEESVSAE